MVTENKHKTTNKLINEKSPYLLQHAHNPVDWYPWGAEAFSRAVSEDKPIFLSIGYSTCHWCQTVFVSKVKALSTNAFRTSYIIVRCFLYAKNTVYII